ncbi:MAG: hypothetical protein KVP17_000126 [Porospora cf. gigantea B]|uniref:uncharacterized protein n=1 Tax=Porospora cf. gigantea B TaxID=2853592 RepID=UPI003571D403|nr:MAG: hypothetical protein KVP17_000126 [Porospora cf. gigantea B]
MVLHGPRADIEAINSLNRRVLEDATPYEATWHYPYKDSAYVYVGGLHYDMTEGDVVIVFSQWGDVVDCNLRRDPISGASKGFGFVGYEDARSAAMAVDNFNGFPLLGRLIRVDHVKDYKVRWAEGEQPPEPTGAEGKGIGAYNVTEHQKEILQRQKERRKLQHQSSLESPDLLS